MVGFQENQWEEVKFTKKTKQQTEQDKEKLKALSTLPPKTVRNFLADDPESLEIEKVSHSLKTQIQQARTAKKNPDGKSWTQADLAKAINVTADIIRDYESGKAIPNGDLLSKMSRVLGVKLKK